MMNVKNAKLGNTLLRGVLSALICLLSAGCHSQQLVAIDCAEVASVSVAGNVSYAKGKGQSYQAAIENAQQNLSQMINTRVTSKCSDEEIYHDKKHAGQTENDVLESLQHCSVQSYSSTRFTYLPVLAEKKCGDQIQVIIELDQRPLAEKLAEAFPAIVALKTDLKALHGKVAFTDLMIMLKAGFVILEFDDKKRLWYFHSKEKKLFVSQEELWEGILWQGCSGNSKFQLESWQDAIQSSQHGKEIELAIESNSNYQILSLFELNEFGGVEVITKNISLAQSDHLKASPLIPYLINGQLRSEFVYLLQLSKGDNLSKAGEGLLNPGSALSKLLTSLLNEPDTEVCVWPITIFI